MPTYQYACTECGHAFEQFQSFSDDALTECPRCQGRLRKLFNAVGVVFKGSGFYRTDSRSTVPSETGSSEGGSSKGAGEGGPSSGAKETSPAKESAGTAGSTAKAGSSASG